MTVINTNVGALMARTYAAKSASRTETSMERLSSGLRINGAADDAAGLAVANKMQSQLIGIKMAIRNSQDGISLVQTAESGMSEISNMILRMRELAVQMENGIYTAKDRDNAQLEVNALLMEIDKIAANTKFNGVDLLDGNYDQTIRAGNTNPETIRVRIDVLSTTDSAKITEFAVEKAVIESDAAVTGSNAQRTALGRTGDYNHATDFDTAQGLAIAAGKFNLSDDGADGVDADGTDTDLNVRDGADFKIDTSMFSTAFKTAFKEDSLGTFTLATVGLAAHNNTNENVRDGDYDTDAEVQAQFQIDAKTGEITLATIAGGAAADADWDYSDGTTDLNSSGGVDAADVALAAQRNFWSFKVVYTKRDGTTHNETINLAIYQATEMQLDDIEVETTAKATRAIETLNKALEEVSSAQAKLGAIQNRLQHNIDNLSKGAMLTEQSVGRVVDADFATETSELSKQQILNQAATAMLAQANQSKQSVLSLLQ
jgi:flagellin